MAMLTIRLTDSIEQQLAQEARRENKTRSEIALDALAWYLTEVEKKRFMTQLLDEARAAYDNNNIRQETQTIAEEFLFIEDDMLENAEGWTSVNLPQKKSTEKWWK